MTRRGFAALLGLTVIGMMAGLRIARAVNRNRVFETNAQADRQWILRDIATGRLFWKTTYNGKINWL